MHFRKLIITGFIAGTAIFLPDLAFAEKAPDADKREQHAAVIQEKLPVQAEKAQAVEKTTAAPVVKKQPTERKPVIEKPAQAKAVVKPPQSKQPTGKPIASLNRSEKAAKTLLPKKVSGQKRGLVKNISKPKPKPNNTEDKKAAVKSIHIESEDVKDTKLLSPGLKDQAESSQDIAKKPVSKMKTAAKAAVQSAPEKRDEPSSSQKERYPKGDNLPNPPSRTKASGGPSSDRTSNGNTSTSFFDKWFIWDQGFYLILTQPFSSRASVFRSQWVNAPPSPPPIEAPVFLPYTDAICHG
ncbi:hypothetical protein V7654_10840 [Bacillus sp. JJ1609]|uniref:hypothetical protein n=1 Tax=Bacillus sp. JJ1609 TaxID=3122977 RepID=UPI002FFED624